MYGLPSCVLQKLQKIQPLPLEHWRVNTESVTYPITPEASTWAFIKVKFAHSTSPRAYFDFAVFSMDKKNKRNIRQLFTFVLFICYIVFFTFL